MKILATTGNDDIARVFLAELDGEEDGRLVEFVEAVQPPRPREEKWVLMVSTLLGCPVGCPICDAGGDYRGRLSAAEILAQLDFLIRRRHPDLVVPARQFKVQLARLGEPALNPAVLEALREMPHRYDAPGLMPSLSTVAPRGREGFFDELRQIKDDLYPDGRFQLQFSIHTTDAALRDELIPIPKWSFSEIASYVEDFLAPRDRRVTLNFALGEGSPVEVDTLLRHFDPASYVLKLTPLNPTYGARERGLRSHIDPDAPERRYEIVQRLGEAGYRVILSFGEREEDRIGSNCGQLLQRHLAARTKLHDGYTYPLESRADRAEVS